MAVIVTLTKPLRQPHSKLAHNINTPMEIPYMGQWGTMDIYSWSLPVVIAVSLLSTLGIMMIDP